MGSAGQWAAKRLCVCVCVCVILKQTLSTAENQAFMSDV